jgi:hypothetical protein
MKYLSREAILALTAGIVALIIPVVAFLSIRFPLKLSTQEQELINFKPISFSIHTRDWNTPLSECPLTAHNAHTLPNTTSHSPSPLHTGLAAITMPDPIVTFILHGTGNRDLAILDGRLLRKGQQMDGIRLVNIEQKRVQIVDRKGKKWLSLE